jgi:hypothetical protein
MFTNNMQISSQDGVCRLTIDNGVQALNSDKKPLSYISMVSLKTYPTPPENSNIIGIAYDFGPDGATFNPPLTLTYTYDSSMIPQGKDESDLTIALWDSVQQKWIELESTVDPETNTIQANISHFCAFAVITSTLQPEVLPEDVIDPSPADSPVEDDNVAIEGNVNLVGNEDEDKNINDTPGIDVERDNIPSNIQSEPDSINTPLEAEAPINWMLIIIIVLGVVVIVLLVLLIIRKRA